MPFHYKALIVVLVLSAIVFILAKPVFRYVMSPEDFARRRNTWLLLSLAVFLSPNFWVYFFIAVPVVLYSALKDTNPAALYLFLVLAVPPLREQIPTLGIVNQVFPMDHLRILSLFLLLPVALRLMSRANEPFDPYQPGASARGLVLADKLLLGFVVLQFVLLVPYESVTTSLRRAVLLGIDVMLPYFVISRACKDREMIVEAMAAFALGAMALVPCALYEVYIRGSLYQPIETLWGSPLLFVYLARGEYYRAQVTAGHSITLGYLFAIALGFWLYLRGRLAPRPMTLLGLVGLCVGMAVTFARGPWIGAAALVMTFLALRPNAGGGIAKLVFAGAIAIGVALVTPLGSKMIEYVPFIGSAGEETLNYRARLFEYSWNLIQLNPVFGNPYYMMSMEDLRQGQGIIDMVNTYAAIALSFGLTGLFLFAAFLVDIVWTTVRTVRKTAGHDPDFAVLGASLVGCLVCTLTVIATTSFGLALAVVTWSLAGLAVRYVRLGRELAWEETADAAAYGAPDAVR
jgi:hypothetical protein